MDKIAKIENSVRRLLDAMCALGKEYGIAEEVKERRYTEEAIFDRGYDAGYDEGYKTAIGKAYTPNL